VQDTKPSKSALKREDQALKVLAEKLVSLGSGDLDRLPLDENLRDAIDVASRIRAHGALRRQRQLIGKLLRQSDAEAIGRALAELGQDGAAEKRRFKRAELWRDRILAEGEAALDDCVAATGADASVLRDLIKRIRGSRSEKTEKTARRELFRVVRDALEQRSFDRKIDGKVDGQQAEQQQEEA